MSFFYDLNKRLAALASKQDQQLTESKAAVEESKFSKLAKEIGKNPKVKNPAAVAATIGREKDGQKAMTAKAVAGKKKANEEELDEAGYSAKAGRAGKDLGKPGKNFAKIAKGAAERYGSKEAGERVAGAVLNKLRHPKEDIADEGNAFTGQLAKTPKGGKFKVGNKEFTDTSSIEESACPTCDCAPCKCNEGNAFTGALAKTPKGGKFKVGNKEFTDNSDLEEGYAEMDAWLKSREKEKGTGKFDVKDTGYSKRYTRKEEPEASDDEVSTEPKRRGRPKGAPKGPERVTAKSYKYKAGRPAKTNEGDVTITDRGEYDDEAGMAKDSLHTIMRHAKELENALHSNENLPEWVQEKIGQIKGMMSSVTDYIISTHERGIEQATGKESITMPVAEKAVSKAQQKFMGMVHAAQKGEKPASKEVAKVAKEMPKKAAKDFASTKHKGLPAHVEEESTEKEDTKAEKAGKKVAKDIEHDEGHKAKGDNKAEKAGKKVTKDIEYDDKKDKEEKVDETTVAGSVATATTSGKSNKGGMQFGKGVYESLDRQFKQALTESISVESTMGECGEGEMSPSITITADGEEAAKLMMLLKLAGLEGQSPATCPTCGSAPCACAEVVDENSPNWPTNTEVGGKNDPTLSTYAGGLNKPKSTGQTTTPTLGSADVRRQVSMEESVKLERSLFNTWKNYKG